MGEKSVGAPKHSKGAVGAQEGGNSLKVSDMVLRNQNQNFQKVNPGPWMTEKVEFDH
jgi:hypothetical protein